MRAVNFRWFGVTLAAVGALASTGCGHRAEADPRTLAPLVRIASIETGNEREREFTGIVSARVQSDLGFRVPGKITARLVDTGQAIHRGEPLMRIDRTDYTLAIAALSAAVDAARAHATQTASDEARYRDLVSAGAISAITYDQAKASADAARAQLEAAHAQLTVSQHEAGYSVLLADADGIVVQTLAEPGQVVTAGQIVVRLAHAGAREATVDLPETIRPTIGSTARATLFNSDVAGSATLRQLSRAADPVTRTFEARYVLDENSAQAPLGSTVTIHIQDTTASATRIPLASLFDGGKGPGVWMVDKRSSTVAWRPLKLLKIEAETAEVSGDLEPGDTFVALGAHQLHEGEKVRTEALLANAR
jgi:RND family efflux transporter MFP subunit